MSALRLIGAGLVVAALIPAVAAAAWKPGTSYFIEESDANRALETYYDSAFCDGIARFGKHGEFPYERYVRFDCTTKRDSDYCIDTRYKAVKAKKRGYFRLVVVRQGSCY